MGWNWVDQLLLQVTDQPLGQCAWSFSNRFHSDFQQPLSKICIFYCLCVAFRFLNAIVLKQATEVNGASCIDCY